MITRLSGTVWSIGDTHLIIRVGGVGFQVQIPVSARRQISGAGQAVDLFTYLHVRENEMTLYGFLTEEELALFKILLSVSGVGPKIAMALLGAVSADTLRQAVARQEPGLLAGVPGIGPKTAKAILFHLKDKIIPSDSEKTPLLSDTDAEVIAALTSLGFSLVEAQTALQNLPRDESLPIEERVRQALAYLAH